jgi:NifU-like protein involved in Fe-S cluster formation
VEHLLKLAFKFNVYEWYKVIAFADDLLLLIRGKSVSEVENIANIELKKSQGGQKKTRSVSTAKSQT